MAIHGVFISPENRDASVMDKALRERFGDVYRVGAEFWLVDTARGADQVAELVRPALAPPDKMFVAALTRDTAATLSAAARVWLTAPERTWNDRRSGIGEGPAGDGPLAIAA